MLGENQEKGERHRTRPRQVARENESLLVTKELEIMSHTNMKQQYHTHFACKKITTTSVDVEMEKSKQRGLAGN